MLQAAGWPDRVGALAQVAKHLGMTDEGRTLSRWAKGEQNPPPDQVVGEKRAELSELLDRALRDAIKSLPDKLDEASYRDTATAIGIFFDKQQLINGQPTQHVQQSGVTFARVGVTTIPQHLAPGAASSIDGTEAV
jgi:hypothetical protein